ncbi:efflux RND transporter periplasmic adaptor subunit [Alishewanella sp. BS5-314]|uniref:efflux RND transporter periplasmic adaptor subunit n=1 Tax=Alishewanella sp. BS5-314 TaxID=2755587 RepID=UPI0021BAE340|nr:efflux RND transporter periplasmic adaptor subunit [Alishewanella sp. BS5-314]MCT8125764.1 efflux RND transporter periplasmic adaptor subunit [Alishewanella sp. BS5-314]
MATKFIKVGLPIIILISAVGLAIGLGAMRKPPAKVVEQRLPLLVNTIELAPQDLTYRIASQGTVSPKLETTLMSEVNGRIIRVAENFVAGGFFKKGDLLVQVEPADYLTAVKAAEAALAGAKAQLEEERARARVAETEWRSFTEGKAPALGLRQPQLASALANVQSKEAELERAQRDLARTEIRAPYDGMVRSRMANLGQFISRGSQLGSILGTEVAEVRLALTDTDFGFLPQQQAQVQQIPVILSATIAGQPLQWYANIVRTEGVLDERSRVIYAVAEIQDPYQREGTGIPLQFGRFVQAQISGIAATQVTKVPRHLLRPGNQLLVVDAEQQLQFRQVQLSRADADFAYIGSGFEAADRLVISPVTNPLAGTQVRLAEQQPLAETVANASAMQQEAQ